MPPLPWTPFSLVSKCARKTARPCLFFFPSKSSRYRGTVLFGYIPDVVPLMTKDDEEKARRAIADAQDWARALFPCKCEGKPGCICPCHRVVR